MISKMAFLTNLEIVMAMANKRIKKVGTRRFRA